MVIIYTSSRRAVLRRFAALLIAPQRFVCYNASIRHATRHSASRHDLLQRAASHRNSTQRFVCYNATNAATWLRSPPRIALRRNSTLRFVMYNATNSAPHGPSLHRVAALHRASLRNSAQLNDLFVTTCRSTTLLSVMHRSPSRRGSTQRFVCYFVSPRSASLCYAPQLGSTICLLQRNERHCAPRLTATHYATLHCSDPQLNSTICLLQCNSTQPNATRLASTRRGSLPLSSTQRFVCYNATQRTAARRTAPSGSAPLRASTQLDDLFVTSLRNALQQYASLLIVPRHNSVQRTETLTRKTNVQTFETNFGNV